MKAVQVAKTGGTEELQLKEVATLIPDQGQIVVQVKAAGVNPVDTYIRAGHYPLSLDFPYTPGFDGAGIIKLIAPDLHGKINLNIGDRVYIARSLSGTYAEEALCLPSQLYPLPDHITFAQGAAINIPYMTAYRALFHKANALPGEWVLIHGASGGVGIACLQFARSRGFKTIGTASSIEGQQLVKEMGAHFVLDHSQDGYLEEISNITQKRGVDVIVEMLANKNLQNDLALLAPKGRIVVVGSRGPIEINPRLLMAQESSILGLLNIHVLEEEAFRIHTAIVSGLQNRILNPVIARELPLSKAAEAHTTIMESKAHGKIVLIP
ncbi:MAG: NADPH:quinone reductase [Oligoflexia bacterium]|nr:NADPH:quinone reductase [Oligoflexia bacterium]MBF0364061.1 NADPH:quinone reductase [Oligoflexia bacterium]